MGNSESNERELSDQEKTVAALVEHSADHFVIFSSPVPYDEENERMRYDGEHHLDPLLNFIRTGGSETLRSLNLYDTLVRDSNVERLALVLGDCVVLTYLNLMCTDMKTSGLLAIANALPPSLNELLIGNDKVTRLEKRALGLMHISYKCFGNKGVRGLMDILASRCPALSQLTIRSALDNHGMAELAGRLPLSLQMLNVESTRYVSNSQKNTSLYSHATEFNAWGLTKLLDGLQADLALRCLKLSENVVGDRGIIALAGALGSMRNLTELHVRGCGMSPNGMEQLANALPWDRLEKLDVSCNAIKDTGGEALARAIVASTASAPVALRELGISLCGLGVLGMKRLCDASELMPFLTHVEQEKNIRFHDDACSNTETFVQKPCRNVAGKATAVQIATASNTGASSSGLDSALPPSLSLPRTVKSTDVSELSERCTGLEARCSSLVSRVAELGERHSADASEMARMRDDHERLQDEFESSEQQREALARKLDELCARVDRMTQLGRSEALEIRRLTMKNVVSAAMAARASAATTSSDGPPMS